MVARETGGWLDWLEERDRGPAGDEGAEWLERTADRVIDKAYLKPIDTVVDIGAGTGLLTMKAARAAPRGRVIAVDASPRCLSQLRKKCDNIGLSNVETAVARLEHLPLESATFDAGLCRSALGYAGELDKAVAEMSRVLLHGGRFSVFEPLTGEMTWNAGEGENVIEFIEMDKVIRERRESSSIDRAKLRGAFERAGFGSCESLVVHFNLGLEGRDEEEIIREYLFDLPGRLSAVDVLENSELTDKDIMDKARVFACSASAGRIKGELPCMFIWGAK